MDPNTPTSARPAILGDILSFDTHPDRDEDLMECTVVWRQDGDDFKEKYVTFKAKNATAGDTKPLVSVFVQKSYYDKEFGTATGWAEFTITDKWQYGQRNKTGADRFVVLHDQARKPYQHRFVASWILELENLVHGIACAFDRAPLADILSNLFMSYLGSFLRSYTSPPVKSGDVLLVPSDPKLGTLETIKWTQNSSSKSAEYYSFQVPNATQKGQNIAFFIQKDWWDGDSTSDNRISKIASKNENGEYEFIINSKSQYGQVDETGKDRWVVYHDKRRRPYQHRFVKSGIPEEDELAGQLKFMAQLFKINVGDDEVEGIVRIGLRMIGDYLHTF